MKFHLVMLSSVFTLTSATLCHAQQSATNANSDTEKAAIDHQRAKARKACGDKRIDQLLYALAEPSMALLLSRVEIRTRIKNSPCDAESAKLAVLVREQLRREKKRNPEKYAANTSDQRVKELGREVGKYMTFAGVKPTVTESKTAGELK